MLQNVLRWLSWLASGLLVLLLAVVAAVWFYTETGHFRERLRSHLLAAVNDALEGEATVRGITGSIWGRLHLHDVTITLDGDPVLSAPRVSVRLGILGQLSGLLRFSTARIREIEIVEPKLNVAQDEDENWNIARLLEDRDEPEPERWAIFIDDLRIIDGTARVRTVDGTEADMTSLFFAGELGLPPTGVQADVERLEFVLAAAGLPRSRWTSAFSLEETEDASTAAIRRLDVSTNESGLRVQGTIDDLSDPIADLRIELVRVSAAEVTELAPAVPLRQDLSGSFIAKGSLSELMLAGNLKAPDGEIAASITADLAEPVPHFRGSAEAKKFVLHRVLTVPGVRGNVNGLLKFDGSSVERIRASWEGTVSGLVVQDWEVGEVASSGELQNKDLSFVAQARTPGGRADVKAIVALLETPAYEATISARSLELRKTLAEKYAGPEAQISADAWIKGRGTDLKTMRVESKLTIHPSEIGPVRIKRGAAEGTLRDGIVILRQARLEADGTTLTAAGKIGSLQQNAAGMLTYGLKVEEMRPWMELAGLDGSGKATAQGTVSGSLESPRLDGKAALSALRLDDNHVGGVNVSWKLALSDTEQWRGQIQMAAKDINAAIRLASLEGDLTLDGTEPLAIQGRLSARDMDQRLHRVAGRLVHSDDETDLLLREIALQLPTGVWRSPRPAHFVLRERTVQIDDFVLQHDGQTLSVSGLAGLQGPQNFVVEVKRFPIEDLRPFFQDWPEVAGNVSLAATVKGTAVQPVIDGKLETDPLTVAGQRYAGLTGRTSYEKERLAVDLRLMQDTVHGLDITGTLPVYLGWGTDRSPAVLGDANLRIRSEGLSPAFLAVVSEDLEKVQGRLSMDIVLRGPLDALAPSGTVRFQDGRARVAPLGLSLTAVDLQANVAPDAIRITSLTAQSGEGRLTGTGRMGLKRYTITSLDLSVNARDFSVINTREHRAAVSGKLAASGTLEEPFVRGGLTVRGTFRPEIALQRRQAPRDPTILVVKRQEDLVAARKPTEEDAKKTKLETNPLYQRLGLDLNVRISRGTWIHVDDGSVEVTGDLRLIKKPHEEVSIAGAVEGVRGSYTFQGRRFQIERAVLTFVGGAQIDPVLEVVGRYRSPQYEIDVVIGGSLSNPTLTLRSDPPLEESDILAVLLFGRPAAELSEGQQTALKTQALKAAADFVAADLQQSVARALGLDTLQFDFGETLTAGRLGIGKYVTEDVYVSATQEFGGEGRQEYIIEYNIDRNWQLRSSTSPQGESGIDIFWRRSY